MNQNVSEVKELAREHGGEVTDVGYEEFGDYVKAFVEVYYEELESVPEISDIEVAENVFVEDDWDSAHNGVMYEVTLSER